MKRFFTYEEYGAHWTTMSQDLTTMCKDLHGWQEYERGVEALQKIVTSVNNREAGSRKALSFSDLLIKVCSSCICRIIDTFSDENIAYSAGLQISTALRGLVPSNTKLR